MRGWLRPTALAAAGALIGGLVAAQTTEGLEVDPDPDAEPTVETGALDDAEALRRALDAEAAGWEGEIEQRRAASVVGRVVRLRALDKLSGAIATVSAPVGEVVVYERLQIEADVCFRRLAERKPESSVFLRVLDTKNDPPDVAFSGWMFASSPALSAMDHPRYDVWVIACETDDATVNAEDEGAQESD